MDRKFLDIEKLDKNLAVNAFQIDEKGVVLWREATIAQLVKGESLYLPRANLASSDLLSIDQTQRMQARLSNFLTAHIKAVLGRLTILATPDQAMPAPATNVQTLDTATNHAEIPDAVRKSPTSDPANHHANEVDPETVAQLVSHLRKNV